MSDKEQIILFLAFKRLDRTFSLDSAINIAS